jgi:putative transposase
MEWARILAYITGTVDQELLLRNEYLVAENRILKSQLKGRLKLSDVERTKLGEIGHRLGRKALGEVAATALPDTILAWYRRLIARKFDGSQARRAPGRPRIDREVEQLIVRNDFPPPTGPSRSIEHPLAMMKSFTGSPLTFSVLRETVA